MDILDMCWTFLLKPSQPFIGLFLRHRNTANPHSKIPPISDPTTIRAKFIVPKKTLEFFLQSYNIGNNANISTRGFTM